MQVATLPVQPLGAASAGNNRLTYALCTEARSWRLIVPVDGIVVVVVELVVEVVVVDVVEVAVAVEVVVTVEPLPLSGVHPIAKSARLAVTARFRNRMLPPHRVGLLGC